MPLKINGKMIGSNNKPYIIAEMSANHNGSLQNALKHVELAAASGADAKNYKPTLLTQ